MIYKYKKYKNIEDFINNKPRSSCEERYTIIHKCKGINPSNKEFFFNDNCFGCLFCPLCSQEYLEKFLLYRGKDFISSVNNQSFRKKPVISPKTFRGLRHPYTSLEKFTGIDETTNIQPWATGLLDSISSKPSRVSMEIPIFNLDYDRNGRLDIGIITSKSFLAVESKISLDEALKDERFIEQHSKYTIEITKYASNYLYLTLFGGPETDLFPPNSEFCTGDIGNKTQRFYNMISQNHIYFITSNALWCLACMYIEKGNKYCWDNILLNIFNDPYCLGLCSAGKIIKDNNTYSIAEI